MNKEYSLYHYIIITLLFFAITLSAYSFRIDFSWFNIFGGTILPKISNRIDLFLSQLNFIGGCFVLLWLNPTNLNRQQRLVLLLSSLILILCNLIMSAPYWTVWFFLVLLLIAIGLNFSNISTKSLSYIIVIGVAFFHLDIISHTNIEQVQYDFFSCFKYIEFILSNNFLFWQEIPLINTATYSSYHPILHFLLAAVGIHLGELLNFSTRDASEAFQVIIVSYMTWYGLISAKILSLFKLSRLSYLSLLGFIVCFPAYNAISGYFNNDCLLLPLQAGMIYYTLLYSQNGGKYNLIMICVFTTMAALTKLSAILILPMIGVAFLQRLFRKRNRQTFREELVCGIFILIGISLWPLYQHFVLYISYDFVPAQPQFSLEPYSIWERFNPLRAIFYEKIFYDYFGTNLWESMTQTALFGRWDFSDSGYEIFWMLQCLTIFYKLIIVITTTAIIYLTIKSNKSYIYFLTIALFAGLIIGIITFNLKHPYMCNQDFRYIAILPLIIAMLLAQFIAKIPIKLTYFLCGILILFSFLSIFIWHFIFC